MDWNQLGDMILLAIVQGIAEFLPISSSGHIVVLGTWLGVKELDDVNVILHMGTLGAILVIYWTKLWQLIGEDRETIPRLIVATIPAVAIGLPLEKFGDEILASPLLAGFMFIITGAILIYISRRPVGKLEYQQLSYRHSLLIGFSQAFAVLPGISRSGTTISAGLQVGLSRESAATFSFLMAVPVIAGAGLLKAIKLIGREQAIATPMPILGIGLVISFLVGLGSLLVLLRLLQRGRIALFAYWCIPLGILVITWRTYASYQ